MGVGEGELVVGGEEAGGPGRGEVGHDLHHHLGPVVVLVRDRFVSEQHEWPAEHRPSEGRPLLLTERDLAGEPADETRQAEAVQQIGEVVRRPGAAETARQADVLLDGELLEEAERLGEKGDLVPGMGVVGAAAQHRDRAGVRFLEPGDDGEQGRLPGARPPHDGHDLALRHREVHPLQHQPRAAVSREGQVDTVHRDAVRQAGGRGHRATRPFAEVHDVVRRLDDRVIVGADDEGGAGARELAHGADQGLPGGGVELGGGLVGEQDQRPADGRGGEGDPLLLPAGQLRRKRPSVVGHADDPEQLDRRLPVDAAKSGRQLDLLDGRQLFEQVVGRVLEDDAHGAATAPADLPTRRRAKSRPPISTVPAFGRCRPARTRSRVDLPEPDGPAITDSRPGSHSRCTSISAGRDRPRSGSRRSDR